MNSKMKVFDTHCHLANKELLEQAPELAQKALAAGVAGMALIAADEFSLRQCLPLQEKLLSQFPSLKVAVSLGLHPHEAEVIDETLWEEVLALAPQAQAIGETGLDYFYEHSSKDTQKDFFKRHIELALREKKPLVIHCRNAATDVIETLEDYRSELLTHPRPGILHCFTETKEVARKLLDLNFMISFSGIMTFKNAEGLREAAAYVPLDKVLIETDSPWLAPVPQRGKKNEPAFVVHVFQELQRIKGVDAAFLQDALWKNSCHIFNLDEHS